MIRRRPLGLPMPRSVVHAGAPRCPSCALAPRWCICGLVAPVTTAIPVLVLIHRQELAKPSSTGSLVARVMPGAGVHAYSRISRHLPPTGLPDDAAPPGHELLVLHPAGAALEPAAAGSPPPCLLLLDGTWRQAAEMLRAVEGLGRCVRLPAHAPRASRFWVRQQRAAGCLATAETLAIALDLLGDAAAAGGLRLHFELHVLATLLSRGKREEAERFLVDSPLLASHPGILDHFAGRGPTPGRP